LIHCSRLLWQQVAGLLESLTGSASRLGGLPTDGGVPRGIPVAPPRPSPSCSRHPPPA
jgi:hypothetical protein